METLTHGQVLARHLALVRAAGLAMLIEMVTAIGIAGVWVAGLILA